ncbi:bifunctional ADP-dependent NAD(P)H-hydrate dehydratase/NAD(P)H-hydrate epimerase [Sporichthya polymorpha]|uniref:bifunctional ADP-dependent NAD(P)H-hydrate dehydratase/NAD(P)H-hydrate epimerase n=1 Tax=Sporichthya polymorpha TaxID=35751 RepID=UPI00036F3029|nr:bifunctional ADP-dependent NAD(P)H-hydrate dehydratase/NAD(P)H-hydrate epimerase [Sporichthya polymorpha]
MRTAHSVADVRAAEAALIAELRRTGQGGDVLMNRAATGLATACAGLLGRVYASRVVLLVGSGDNGGDALYAGAQLARRGARVDALLLHPDRAHARGLAAFRGAGGRVAPDAAVLDHADLVLDGIVGIGGSGGLRPGAAELVSRAELGGGLIVAVDLPSGVDADTGEVPGVAVHADVTVTFGTWKPGLLIEPGASHAGATTLVDIGLGDHLPDPAACALQDADVLVPFGWLLPTADKYRRGVVGVVAGSKTYPGAAVLAVGGALRAGAGMVRFAGPGRVADAVRAAWPEAVVTEGLASDAGRVQAWVVGPGLGTGAKARRRLDAVLGSDVPVLVDADGLTLLAEAGGLERSAPTLLTPHAGELGRLLTAEGVAVEGPAVEAARLAHARRAAEQYGATVLLKGSTTVVVPPDGPVRVNPTGTPRLATAGSGDVLAGLAGTLLAAGRDPADAAATAAYLHGLAARLAAEPDEAEAEISAPGPVTATDIAAALPAAWRHVAGA